MHLVFIFKFHASVREQKYGKYILNITHSNSCCSNCICFQHTCPILQGDDLSEKKMKQIYFGVYLIY